MKQIICNLTKVLQVLSSLSMFLTTCVGVLGKLLLVNVFNAVTVEEAVD